MMKLVSKGKHRESNNQTKKQPEWHFCNFRILQVASPRRRICLRRGDASQKRFFFRFILRHGEESFFAAMTVTYSGFVKRTVSCVRVFVSFWMRTRILRHMASELNLNMRSDGYVKVQDLLKLNMKTFANIPLRSHSVDNVKEAVMKDNKQRFSLLEENGELLIRANQGHTVALVETESLLRPILSAEEFPVCVHGTYKKNLASILESGLKCMQRLHVHFSCGLPTDGKVISGMRRDVNMLIFLDVGKALKEGMKLYISDNKVILTEGFDGVVPVKCFEKIESWPDREAIPFQIHT